MQGSLIQWSFAFRPGIHLFFKGKITEPAQNTKTGVEMYEHTRYFTMTGNKLDVAKDTIAEITEHLNGFMKTFIRIPKKKKKSKRTRRQSFRRMSCWSCYKCGKMVKRSKNCGMVSAGRLSSQSEADNALC